MPRRTPVLKMLEENIAEALSANYESLAAMKRVLTEHSARVMKRWRWIIKRYGPKHHTSSAGRTRSKRWRAGSKRTRKLAREGHRRGGRI